MNHTDMAEIMRLANAILRGEIEVVEGCRLLVPLFRDAGIRNDPDARVIVGVESETDDLPIGAERANWDAAALAAKDAEKEEYVGRIRGAVMAACRALSTKFLPS